MEYKSESGPAAGKPLSAGSRHFCMTCQLYKFTEIDGVMVGSEEAEPYSFDRCGVRIK